MTRRRRNWLGARAGKAVPPGVIRIDRQTARIIGTTAHDVVFVFPVWRDVDPRSLSEAEIAALERSHGWRILRA